TREHISLCAKISVISVALTVGQFVSSEMIARSLAPGWGARRQCLRSIDPDCFSPRVPAAQDAGEVRYFVEGHLCMASDEIIVAGIVLAALGVVTAIVAVLTGRPFLSWLLYGIAFWPLALFHLIFWKPRIRDVGPLDEDEG